MKHYLWYDSNGRLTGYSFDGDNGWVGCPLDDASSTNPTAVGLRDAFLTQDGNAGCIELDCSCPTVDPTCTCPNSRLMDRYWDGSALAARRDVQMNLDGVDISHLAFLDMAAGTTVPFKVVDGLAADGETCALKDLRGEMVGGEVVLTFTGGETNAINLTVPPSTIVGAALLDGLKIKVQGFSIRGA